MEKRKKKFIWRNLKESKNLFMIENPLNYYVNSKTKDFLIED
jgi:hypothetical protein